MSDANEMPDFMSLYGREKRGMPDGWTVFSWSTADEEVPAGFIKVTGAVVPSGRTSCGLWRRRERGTEKTLFLDTKDFKSFQQAMADREGRCLKCWGSGQEWAGWSVTEGNRFRPCTDCGATGKPALAQAESPR